MSMRSMSICWTVTAHKVYGPKGIGALYVRRRPRVRVEAQMHGGGHERGLRSGTLPTHQIVGMGEAFRLAKEEMEVESSRVGALRDRLLAGSLELDEVYVNGDLTRRIAHNLNVSFNFVEGESLIMGIKGVAVSSGPARHVGVTGTFFTCCARSAAAMNWRTASIRLLGRFTTEAEVDEVIRQVQETVAWLRALSPLWDMHLEGIDLNTIQWAAH